MIGLLLRKAGDELNERVRDTETTSVTLNDLLSSPLVLDPDRQCHQVEETCEGDVVRSINFIYNRGLGASSKTE